MRSSKSKVVLTGLFVLSACCFAFACRGQQTINADKSSDGRTLTLRVGDGVDLSLAENPTTGYRWELLARPEPVCVVVSDAYVANTGGAIGGGGAHTWELRAVDKGTVTVSLGYRRPWEKDVAPAEKFALTIVVK
ncbi:MAG TPA: protease inhibitor I42 family protein [Candidatus Acidoferrum sp.]|jgi:inhibitor of cysteine peptidase